MNNFKISILCTMIIATSMSGSQAQLQLKDPIIECAIHKAIHDHMGRIEDEKIQTMEAEFKKCLRTNLHSTNLGAFGIPVECVEQARIFILEAGRDRAREIIADFKAAIAHN